MTDIDVNNNIYGIANNIGYSGGYANMLIDNTSIEINNANGNRVYGIANYTYSNSTITLASSSLTIKNITSNNTYGIADTTGCD